MNELLPHEIEFWGRFVNVHPPEVCSGQTCIFHNPSDHHMRPWAMNWRYDRYPPIVERVCPTHGVGHPDPDNMAYLVPLVGDWVSVHGCCGCCSG